MFKNYIKIALRNFLKRKTYSLISILGLSIGITCCFLIMLYVKQETSFDRFHNNADRIYRLAVETERAEGKEYTAATPFPVAPVFKQEFPEVEYVTRIFIRGQVLIGSGEKRYVENNIFHVNHALYRNILMTTGI